LCRIAGERFCVRTKQSDHGCPGGIAIHDTTVGNHTFRVLARAGSAGQWPALPGGRLLEFILFVFNIGSRTLKPVAGLHPLHDGDSSCHPVTEP
jgi:hypothetical protein